MRVLISSSCSFWLSREAVLRARELDASWAFPDHIAIKGEEGSWLNDEKYQREEQYSLDHRVPRHDPILLQVFDELGQRMSADEGSEIKCVEVPDDLEYFVGSYLGEWIAEAHRTWTADTGLSGESGGGPVFTKDSKFSDFAS
jgi:hypothetical protein